ncbi:subtilase family protein [Lysobacter capsici]|uniref:S8 family peptidase n=1 Tax=Lysobacter capsici TaxID=435897 RepID=UPI00071676B9|nr:S8/S53 family peptidase [Lysobacter capsici]ALN87817.1 subtilase family protein [Lysobacter capsici]
MESVLLDIVSAWDAEQKTRVSPDSSVRFVIEAPPPERDLHASVASVLALEFALAPLFDGGESSEDFILLTVPGVDRPDRADLFEVANALRAATGATTVEPDVGSDYYQQQSPPPDGGSVEAANWTFWCWAKEQPQEPDWAVERIRAPDAWDYSQQLGRPHGGEGISVFQPDTGVVHTHTALPRDIADDPRSANFVEPGKKPIDPLLHGMNPGHGTGTGSVVISANGTMRGSAPKARLVPIRCTESVAVFDQSRVAQAIDYARRQGAHVITMSLGGVPSRALHAAVRKAVSANVIVLAAAGNCVTEVVWPARYAEMIALGGTNEKSQPWRGSCRGESVTVSAPGEFVLRADGNDTQQPPARVSASEGTSFATALTAGVAALWLAHHGRDALIAAMSPPQTLQEMLRRLLRRSADKPEGFDHNGYGAGIVDALALLKLSPASAWTGVEAVQEVGEHDVEASLRTLLAAAYGPIGAEAAAPALDDPQHHAELACVAFDRLRVQPTLRARVETPPTPSMSPGLRQLIGAPLDAPEDLP